MAIPVLSPWHSKQTRVPACRPRRLRVPRTGRAGTRSSSAAPARAAASPHFQMPFACGETWEGSSRASHSPSPLVDRLEPRRRRRGPAGRRSAPGVVTSVVDLGNSSYGLYVVIDHGGGWTTLHAHLDRSFWSPAARRRRTGDRPARQLRQLDRRPLHYEQRLNRATGTGSSSGDASRTTPGCSRELRRGARRRQLDGSAASSVGRVQPQGRRRGLPGAPLRDGQRQVTLGPPTDQPLTGDWNGDGRSDVGRVPDARAGGSSCGCGRDAESIGFGREGDIAVTGDWNGDGAPTSASSGPRRPRSGSGRRWRDVIRQIRKHARASRSRATGTVTDARRSASTTRPPAHSGCPGRSAAPDGDLRQPRLDAGSRLLECRPGDRTRRWDPATGTFSERISLAVTTSIRFGHRR